MVGRPVNEARRAELLDAVVDYTVQRGLTALTWRQVANAVGVSPTTLVHHFGTREGMLVAVHTRLRERILAEIPAVGAKDLPSYVRAVWRRVSEPARQHEFRLFFAVYGQALQAPKAYADFLAAVVAEWMAALCAAQGDGVAPREAERRATLVIATIRGLLLDLLATGDRKRVNAAAEHFVATLREP